MKTHYALGLIFLFALTVFLGNYSFTKEIDKEIPAVLSIADTPYPYETSASGEAVTTHTSKPTTIRIQGEVYRKVFRKPEFHVEIKVDYFNWMDDHYAQGPFVFYQGGGVYIGNIQYAKSKPNGAVSFDHIKSANVWFNDEFDQVHLMASTEDWMGDAPEDSEMFFVTGAAENEEQAQEVLRQIRESWKKSVDEKDLDSYTEVIGP